MSESEKVYVHQAFPKWKYHKDKAPVLVQSDQDEAALGAGWVNSPADVVAQGAAPAVPVIESADIRADAPIAQEQVAVAAMRAPRRKKPQAAASA